MLIINNDNYHEALTKGWFATATMVWLENLPCITSLPDMPAATKVWLSHLPGVTSLPEMPAAIEVWLDGKRLK
jgi:hypothetical protein